MTRKPSLPSTARRLLSMGAGVTIAAASLLSLPAMAWTQGWDWDEDFAPSRPAACSDDGASLELWLNDVVVGTVSTTPSECSTTTVWG